MVKVFGILITGCIICFPSVNILALLGYKNVCAINVSSTNLLSVSSVLDSLLGAKWLNSKMRCSFNMPHSQALSVLWVSASWMVTGGLRWQCKLLASSSCCHYSLAITTVLQCLSSLSQNGPLKVYEFSTGIPCDCPCVKCVCVHAGGGTLSKCDRIWIRDWHTPWWALTHCTFALCQVLHQHLFPQPCQVGVNIHTYRGGSWEEKD